MDSFISYNGLPLNSGGAHSLGRKPVDEIYADVKSFLQDFTDCKEAKESDIVFYTSHNKSYKTLPVLWSLIKVFGIPSYGNWNLGHLRQHFYTWKLKKNNIEKGFEILQKYKDLGENKYGPIVLSFKWQFQFVEIGTKKILSGQDKIPVIDERQQNSQMYLRLGGQKSTISVWFAFPFSALNEKAFNYIKSLTGYLPFRLSEKNWRVWKKSKGGNWISRVLEVSGI